MPADPTDLIQFIVWYANTQEIELTTIRVIKFLYLADLYHAREGRGQTLTGLPWAFIHYGPYCGEAMECVEDATKMHKVEAVPFKSKYAEGDYYLYRSRVEQEPSIVASLPVGVVSNLKFAIRKWGADTPGLLNHVYFETEPMRRARPGSRLDFSTATPVEIARPIEMRRLSKDEIAKSRVVVTRLKEKFLRGLAQAKAVDREAVVDEVYRQTMQFLDQPLSDEPLTGRAKLSTEPQAEQ